MIYVSKRMQGPVLVIVLLSYWLCDACGLVSEGGLGVPFSAGTSVHVCFTTLWANAADDKPAIFFILSQKISFDIPEPTLWEKNTQYTISQYNMIKISLSMCFLELLEEFCRDSKHDFE